MELSFIEMFGLSIISMIAIFFIYFSARAIIAYHNLSENLIKIFSGSAVAGIGTGVLIGILLWCVLPTHYTVTSTSGDKYFTKYVINEKFGDEYGRCYITNKHSEEIYIVGMTYGDASFDDDDEPVVEIKPNTVVETKHEIDEWFEKFPDQVSSKSSGKIKWHVLTADQAASEISKVTGN